MTVVRALKTVPQLVFGGFTRVSWSTRDSYHSDDTAFLFSNRTNADQLRRFVIRAGQK